jgi:hypothetical protein
MTNEFITNASQTLKEAAKTMHERGNQYADTWGKDACWHLTKSVLEKYKGQEPNLMICKAVALASFIDQKYSRFAGGYKHDTTIDLISYLAALAETLKLENQETESK